VAVSRRDVTPEMPSISTEIKIFTALFYVVDVGRWSTALLRTSMMELMRELSLRELNRTTLARQLLLERATIPAEDAVERLVGLQAQVARPPFVGLWTRLTDFRREVLADQIEKKHVVKATFIRGTLHLLTKKDYLRFRATLQPVLSNALEDVLKGRGATVDVQKLVDAAREFMHAEPRSFAEITSLLTGLVPDGDPGGMRYAVRTHLPMIQVPIQKAWSYPGNPRFALAEDWLGRPIPTQEHLHDLVKRYLAAFGPATVNDMQTWSYLTNLQPVFDKLKSDLTQHKDERGRDLFDLPDLSIEAEDASAPVRFLPEFDNVLMAHQDRSRIVPNAYRSKVYLPGLRVAASVLIDGFVAGVWTTERVKREATLRIEPFSALSPHVKKELTEEGKRLLRFAEPEAKSFTVRLTG
jgi:hypothetical protein